MKNSLTFPSHSRASLCQTTVGFALTMAACATAWAQSYDCEVDIANIDGHTGLCPGVSVSGPTLILSGGGDIRIHGSVVHSGNHKLPKVVVNNASATNITLDNASITTDVHSSVFRITEGSTVNLMLLGDNVLTSGQNGAGLEVGKGNTVVIDGPGSLRATAVYYGAGIGARLSDASGTIIINGGTITAQGGTAGPGMGGSGHDGGQATDGGTIIINGGTVVASGGSRGTGIGGGGAREEGTAGAGGSITINGGDVTASGGNYGTGIGGGYSRDGIAGAGGIITINGGDVTAMGGARGTGIGGGYGLDAGGAGGDITIKGGSVTATGNHRGAGIGGGGNGSVFTGGAGGVITIDGGAIAATGGNDGGAGIGGGYAGAGGNVTIKGGIIAAAAGNDGGAGIGGGAWGFGGSATVSGGAIVVSGGQSGAGIGGGKGRDGGDVTISGGTITVTSGAGAAGIGGGSGSASGGSVTITGGSIKTDSVQSRPTNGVVDVFLNTLTVEGINTVTRVERLDIDDVPNYGIHGVYTDAGGKLYFWLPASSGRQYIEATLGDDDYGAIYTRAPNNGNTRTLRTPPPPRSSAFNAPIPALPAPLLPALAALVALSGTAALRRRTF